MVHQRSGVPATLTRLQRFAKLGLAALPEMHCVHASHPAVLALHACTAPLWALLLERKHEQQAGAALQNCPSAGVASVTFGTQHQVQHRNKLLGPCCVPGCSIRCATAAGAMQQLD